MTEHYTTDTLSVTKWCNQCGRNTAHTVSAGRVGRCIEHDAPQYSKKQLADRARRESEAQNPRLF